MRDGRPCVQIGVRRAESDIVNARNQERKDDREGLEVANGHDGVARDISLVGIQAHQGHRAESDEDVDRWYLPSTVRSIGVETKKSFYEMNKVIEAKIKTVINKTSFHFNDIKAAYQYMVSIFQNDHFQN